MARPKSVPDADILAAAARVLDRVGPHRMTLADVGAEVGLSAPALIQRFGTKRALLLAVAESAAPGVERAFRDARAADAAPLDALLRALTTQMHDTPQSVASGLAFLQIDVTDPEFRAHAAAVFDALETQTRALLDDAKARGDLLPTADSAALARAVVVAVNGSILVWAIRQAGTADAAVRGDVEAVLAPHRARGRLPLV